MAEFTTTKLNAESHLLLDQPLLRLPHELARRNHKSVQQLTEHERNTIIPMLKDVAQNSITGAADPAATLSTLETMITRMQGLKRKLEILNEEEQRIHRQSAKRIQHLEDLYHIPSLADVKYDEWSRIRLNRLLVDYLLRMGYSESARQLAREKDIEDLVDLDVFVSCQRIADSLNRGETKECLAWCAENKALLLKSRRRDKDKKAKEEDGSGEGETVKGASMLLNLEFELRLQQFIEMVRNKRSQEAMLHARRFLAPSFGTQLAAIQHAAGLLAYPPNTHAEPYRTLYSSQRYPYLSNLYLRTHHTLLSLPASPLLHTALSAGLSALKTPSCHSTIPSTVLTHPTPSISSPPPTGSSPTSSPTTTHNNLDHSNNPFIGTGTTSVCPICSTELNELARNVPYAHHTKSHVEQDPVVLPNGRVYGRERLMASSKGTAGIGLDDGMVKDPTTGEVFREAEVRKVFIS